MTQQPVDEVISATPSAMKARSRRATDAHVRSATSGNIRLEKGEFGGAYMGPGSYVPKRNGPPGLVLVPSVRIPSVDAARPASDPANGPAESPTFGSRIASPFFARAMTTSGVEEIAGL
jgi:hypothetical protein